MADQVQGSFPAETVGKKQRHAMEKRILTSLDAMCSLKVKRKGGKRRLLLYPEESFSLDGRTGMIKRRLSASLFDLRHIESCLLYTSSAHSGRRLPPCAQVGQNDGWHPRFLVPSNGKYATLTFNGFRGLAGTFVCL